MGLPIFHLVLAGLMQLGFGLGVRRGTGLGWMKLEGKSALHLLIEDLLCARPPNS